MALQILLLERKIPSIVTPFASRSQTRENGFRFLQCCPWVVRRQVMLVGSSMNFKQYGLEVVALMHTDFTLLETSIQHFHEKCMHM